MLRLKPRPAEVSLRSQKAVPLYEVARCAGPGCGPGTVPPRPSAWPSRGAGAAGSDRHALAVTLAEFRETARARHVETLAAEWMPYRHPSRDRHAQVPPGQVTCASLSTTGVLMHSDAQQCGTQ